MTLVSWEYYSSHHDAIKNDDDFSKAEQLAEQAVSLVIGPIRWADLVETDLSGKFYRERLLDCICQVIDYQKQTKGKLGAGVSSVSNDGYSESYVLPTLSAANEELSRNIRAWLSGTGLVGAY